MGESFLTPFISKGFPAGEGGGAVGCQFILSSMWMADELAWPALEVLG